MELAQAVFLVQVGFWDITSQQPTDKYLETLDFALASGLRHMIVMTVPTQVASAEFADATCATATSCQIAPRVHDLNFSMKAFVIGTKITCCELRGFLDSGNR